MLEAFKNSWFFFIILFSLIIITMFFPLKDSIYFRDFLLNCVYLTGALIGYSYIQRLKIRSLCLGAGLIIFGIIIDIIFNITSIDNLFYLFKLAYNLFLSFGVFILCFSMYKIIREYEEKERQIRYLSFHDPLTGVYNRRYFENEIERLNNSRKLPVSIIMADVDDLKKINDTYGHKIGDEHLVEAAEIINNIIRNEDIVARIGGDEFAIILPETDEKTAAKVCERISEECKKYKSNLDISLGFATKTKKEKDLEHTLTQADKHMYSAKKQK